MQSIRHDLVVVGGGPAGLAAAVAARKNGCRDVLLIERARTYGGILNQCIHDGFGVEETGVSMTGPEYADMYLHRAEKYDVQILKETMVIQVDQNRDVIAVNKDGVHYIPAKALILAMGCREKTRWNAMIPGTRPSGIYTAGVAQACINLYNIMPGKNIVILGSGNVGLIMARRLKFEGAHVLGVVEMLPYASGLPRNVVQCLDDYDIPLYLHHTIASIEGQDRLESVTIVQVDETMTPLQGTEQQLHCDTLLLSLGLIPENELSKDAGVAIDDFTGGPAVDQNLETTIPGVFTCGNCLQVYDTVDQLAIDAYHAGSNAACYGKKKKQEKTSINVLPGEGVRSLVPQRITRSGRVRLTVRAIQPMEKATFCVTSGGKQLLKKRLPWVNPANMIIEEVDIPPDVMESGLDIEVSIA